MTFRFLTLGLPTVDAEHAILNGFIDGLTILIEYNDITAPSTAEVFISYFNRHIYIWHQLLDSFISHTSTFWIFSTTMFAIIREYF